MAITPNEHFDDELLSAYLDGELDAKTRAFVDERLRTDERAHKLLAELRQASEAVKALPRGTLGRDLRGSVLAAIEKADIEPATIPMRGGADVVHSTGRGWMWAGLAVAIAASVMILAVIPQQRRNEDAGNARQVAAASKDAKEREAKSAGEATVATAPPADSPMAESPSAEALADAGVSKTNEARAPHALAAAAPSAAGGAGASSLVTKGDLPPAPATAAGPADEAAADDVLDVQVIESDDAVRFNEILVENEIDVIDTELPVDVKAKLAEVAANDSALEAVLVEATPQQLAAIRQSLAGSVEGAVRYADGAQRSRAGQEAAESIRGRAWRLTRLEAATDTATAPPDSAAQLRGGQQASGGEAGRAGLVRALFLIKRAP